MQPTTCPVYPTKYTVKVILIDCTDLVPIKQTFYLANNMKFFQKTEMNNVI